MIKICFLGILIGSFSLTLVTAIMNGFEKATHEKMQGIHAQLIMRSPHDSLDEQAVSQVLIHEFPQVAAFSPTALHQAIIQPYGSNDVTNVIMLKAIHPEKETAVTSLNSKIIASITQNTLIHTIKDDAIVIGKSMADQLNIKVGDTVHLLYTQDESSYSRRITLQQKSVHVAGVFSTGIEEFDNTLALCSFSLFNALFPEYGITQFNIKLNSDASELATIAQLKKRFQLEVFSWKDMYPALVSALRLEKYVMFIILALITLVASMNIISLLFMQITQKRGDIAILKALGASNSSITQTFLIMGTLITTSATALGIVLATLACWVLQTYPFITLPDAYYVSHLPAVMEWPIVITICIVILSISFFASWIPTRRSKSINISRVLRFEA